MKIRKIRNAAVAFVVVAMLAPVIGIAAPFFVARFVWRETDGGSEP